MKKLLLTVCSIALLSACGCGHKGTDQGGSQSYGMSSSVPHSVVEELDNKIGDRVFFAFNSSALSDKAKEVLSKQAEFIKKHPEYDYVISGYCDKRGTVEYNLALGERRANSVKHYFTSHGISSKKFTVISYGKERPAVLGDTEEAFRQNRRAVLTIKD